MPINSYMQYAIIFALPDREHLAVMRAPTVRSDDEKRWLVTHAKLQLSANPDAKIVDIVPIDEANSIEHIRHLAVKLDEKYPDQPGAAMLGLDTPARILTDVEIPRSLAAMKIPGGARIDPSLLGTSAARSASPQELSPEISESDLDTSAPAGTASEGPGSNVPG